MPRDMVGVFLAHVEALAKRLDHFAHQHLGRRRARGEPDRPGCPSQSQSMSAARWIRRAGRPSARRPRPGAANCCCWGADHQHPLALGRDRLDRRLAVGRRVANVLACAAPGSPGKRAAAPRRSPRCRRPTGSSGSGRPDCRDRRHRPPRVVDRLDQGHRPFGDLAEGADHLGMPGMADEQDVAARPRSAAAPGGGPC